MSVGLILLLCVFLLCLLGPEATKGGPNICPLLQKGPELKLIGHLTLKTPRFSAGPQLYFGF